MTLLFRRWRVPGGAIEYFLLATLLSALILAFTPTGGASAATDFVVNTTSDLADTNPGDGVCDVDETSPGDQCTLRGAIQEANRHVGANNIIFGIPGEGVKTIKLTGQLPPLTDESGPTSIDGYTQPGASPNTDALRSNARIMVQVEGNGYGGFDGLPIWSPGNAVRGIAFYRIRGSIKVFGTEAHDNKITGNFIGTDASGTAHSTKRYKYWGAGIRLTGGASNNTIGGVTVAERNVISGNGAPGVSLFDAGTNSNRIVGNLIGLTPSGTASLRNYAHGVDINAGASGNVVGGTTAAERNVISGNGDDGVEVSHGRPDYGFPSANRVVGNFIGTGPAGEGAPAFARNGVFGVHLEDGARGNVVSANVIGNNRIGGVGIEGSYTKNNEVSGNRIGVSRGGARLGNGVAGVRIFGGAKASQVGPANVVANNPAGVQVGGLGTRFQTITRNSIYGNTGLGIDLKPFGTVNKNDPGDSDGGANHRQNRPTLASASTSDGLTTIRGTLESTPRTGFVVEFFSNPKGTNEGKTFVGQKSVKTGAGGKASYVIRPSSAIKPGRTVTATATSQGGETSELSSALTVKRS